MGKALLQIVLVVLKPDLIDRLRDAGLATVNLAVDSVKERQSLPKAMEPIRPHFDYLVKRFRYYGYSIMLNINICRNNLDDVKELSEIAHDNVSPPTTTSMRLR